MEAHATMNYVVWVPAAAAVAVAGVAAWRTRKTTPLVSRMGSPSWDFGQSWASTFTGASALVGSTLSSQLLADNGLLLARHAYVSLALFFASLAILAPMLYASARELVTVTVTTGPSKSSRTEQYQGRVAAYFVAGAITLWAFFGQVLLAGMLFSELRAADRLPAFASGALQALLALTGALTAVHSSSSLASTARRQRAALDQGRTRILAAGADGEPELPNWPLL